MLWPIQSLNKACVTGLVYCPSCAHATRPHPHQPPAHAEELCRCDCPSRGTGREQLSFHSSLLPPYLLGSVYLDALDLGRKINGKGTASHINKVLLKSSLVNQCSLWSGHPGTDSLVGAGVGLWEPHILIWEMGSIQDDF